MDILFILFIVFSIILLTGINQQKTMARTLSELMPGSEYLLENKDFYAKKKLRFQ